MASEIKRSTFLIAMVVYHEDEEIKHMLASEEIREALQKQLSSKHKVGKIMIARI